MSLIVSVLLISTLLTITVNERLGEIATLRAIGVARLNDRAPGADRGRGAHAGWWRYRARSGAGYGPLSGQHSDQLSRASRCLFLLRPAAGKRRNSGAGRACPPGALPVCTPLGLRRGRLSPPLCGPRRRERFRPPCSRTAQRLSDERSGCARASGCLAGSAAGRVRRHRRSVWKWKVHPASTDRRHRCAVTRAVSRLLGTSSGFVVRS